MNRWYRMFFALASLTMSGMACYMFAHDMTFEAWCNVAGSICCLSLYNMEDL